MAKSFQLFQPRISSKALMSTSVPFVETTNCGEGVRRTFSEDVETIAATAHGPMLGQTDASIKQMASRGHFPIALRYIT